MHETRKMPFDVEVKMPLYFHSETSQTGYEHRQWRRIAEMDLDTGAGSVVALVETTVDETVINGHYELGVANAVVGHLSWPQIHPHPICDDVAHHNGPSREQRRKAFDAALKRALRSKAKPPRAK